MDKGLVRCRVCHKTWVTEESGLCFDCAEQREQRYAETAARQGKLRGLQRSYERGGLHLMMGNSNKE